MAKPVDLSEGVGCMWFRWSFVCAVLVIALMTPSAFCAGQDVLSTPLPNYSLPATVSPDPVAAISGESVLNLTSSCKFQLVRTHVHSPSTAGLLDGLKPDSATVAEGRIKTLDGSKFMGDYYVSVVTRGSGSAMSATFLFYGNYQIRLQGGSGTDYRVSIPSGSSGLSSICAPSLVTSLGRTSYPSFTNATGTPVPAPSSPIEVTVLAAYTPEVEEDVGPSLVILSSLFEALTATNRVFVNSNVGISLRLNHYMKLSQSEAEVLDGSDLDIITHDGDGSWDDVHPPRVSRNADVVALLTRHSQGIAKLMNADTFGTLHAPFAFFKVTEKELVSRRVFPHELGHVLGAQHAIEMGANANPAFPFAYAWNFGTEVQSGFSFHNVDVMHQGTVTLTALRPRMVFSNPLVFFDGVATGLAWDPSNGSVNGADNARALNEIAPLASQWGGSGIPAPTPLPGNLVLSAQWPLSSGSPRILTSFRSPGGALVNGIKYRLRSGGPDCLAFTDIVQSAETQPDLGASISTTSNECYRAERRPFVKMTSTTLFIPDLSSLQFTLSGGIVGGGVALAGTVRDVGGVSVPLEGQWVQVVRRPSGGGTFSSIGYASVSAEGSFSFSTSQFGEFRVHARGYPSNQSGSVEVAAPSPTSTTTASPTPTRTVTPTPTRTHTPMNPLPSHTPTATSTTGSESGGIIPPTPTPTSTSSATPSPMIVSPTPTPVLPVVLKSTRKANLVTLKVTRGGIPLSGEKLRIQAKSSKNPAWKQIKAGELSAGGVWKGKLNKGPAYRIILGPTSAPILTVIKKL